MVKKFVNDRKIVNFLFKSFFLCGLINVAYAIGVEVTDSSSTIGSMAAHVTATFSEIGNLITAGSYISGLAFSVGAIMKFKQHKDNPTQIPIGTPISLVLISAALLFMPTLLKTVGASMFGAATTAGSAGTTISNTK